MSSITLNLLNQPPAPAFLPPATYQGGYIHHLITWQELATHTILWPS